MVLAVQELRYVLKLFGAVREVVMIVQHAKFERIFHILINLVPIFFAKASKNKM
jgi:hypothetical protein